MLRGVQERLRAALARPGTRLQRALRRLTGFLMAALPMLALLWVAYKVVVSYWQASTTDSTYLGTNFAVSSILLIVVAWAVPFVCDRMLRPSLERTALQALRRGVADGLDQLDKRLHEAVAEVARAAQAGRDDANGVGRQIAKLALQPVDSTKAPLSRLLVTPARQGIAHRSVAAESGGSRAG